MSGNDRNAAGHSYDEKTGSSEHDTKYKKDVATSSLSESALLLADVDRRSTQYAWRCDSVSMRSSSHAATSAGDTWSTRRSSPPSSGRV